jgi:hypothetical protein
MRRLPILWGDEMIRLLSAAALAVCLIPTAYAGDDENPFKKAKVGDYTEYKLTSTIMGTNVDGTTRMTVTAKDDKEATIEVTGKVRNMGTEVNIPPQKQKIDLTKPFDPTSMANLPKGGDVKVEKGDAPEKIMAGGKQYECNWMKAASTFKVGDMSIQSDIKVWLSKDVPLSGIVKMELKSKLANMTMELTGSGSK